MTVTNPDIQAAKLVMNALNEILEPDQVEKVKSTLKERAEALNQGNLEEQEIDKSRAMQKFVGGATSFEEVEANIAARDLIDQLDDLIFVAGWVADNIIWDDMIEDKPAALIKMAQELLSRLQAVGRGEPGLNKEGEGYTSEDGSLTIRKSTSGQWSLLGKFTNKFQDREKDILTDQSHREFEKYLDQNPDQAPELWVFHTPGTQFKNKADWWAYDGSFFYLKWNLTEEEADRVIEWCKEVDPGMSHGFWAIDLGILIEDQEGYEINKYRTYEASLLPLQSAANIYTGITLMSKHITTMKKGFDPTKRQALIQFYGDEEFVEGLENQSSKEARLLEENVMHKTNEIEEETPQDPTREADQVDEVEEAEDTEEGEEGEGSTPDEEEVEESLEPAAVDEKSLHGILTLLNDTIAGLSKRVDNLETKSTSEPETPAAPANSNTLASMLAKMKAEGNSPVGNPQAQVKEGDGLDKGPEEAEDNTEEGGHQLKSIFG